MKRKYNENRKFSMKDVNFKNVLDEYVEFIDNVEKTKKVDRDELIEFREKSKLHKFLSSNLIKIVGIIGYDMKPYVDIADVALVIYDIEMIRYSNSITYRGIIGIICKEFKK